MDMVPLAPVVLTDEEMQECADMLRAILPKKNDSGSWFIKEGLLGSFKDSIVALCMMGRAERFLDLAGCGSLSVPLLSPWIREDEDYRLSQAEYKNKACEAAAKACAVFPLSIYFFDFACVLQQVGKPEEARLLFAEFLRRHGTEQLDAIMQRTLNQRDLAAAVAQAHAALLKEPSGS